MIDNTRKLITFTKDQTISNAEYKTVYELEGKGSLDCIVFSTNSTDMLLNLVLDGVKVIDGFLLKDLKSNYEINDGVDLPLVQVGNKAFRYRLEGLQTFKESLKVQLKHNQTGNKKFVAGYIMKE